VLLDVELSESAVRLLVVEEKPEELLKDESVEPAVKHIEYIKNN
jgi:hypothetical protein